MKWYSEVVIGEDNKSANYELKVQAESKEKGASVEVSHQYPVNKFFDQKGYFHIRKAHDQIIDDILDRLQKEINRKV